MQLEALHAVGMTAAAFLAGFFWGRQTGAIDAAYYRAKWTEVREAWLTGAPLPSDYDQGEGIDDRRSSLVQRSRPVRPPMVRETAERASDR